MASTLASKYVDKSKKVSSSPNNREIAAIKNMDRALLVETHKEGPGKAVSGVPVGDGQAAVYIVLGKLL
jgi:hypothetical protein